MRKNILSASRIEKLETTWTKHPILHLDLNTEKYDTPEALKNKLNTTLFNWEKLYGAVDYERTLASRFEGIIQHACEQAGERVEEEGFVKFLMPFYTNVSERKTGFEIQNFIRFSRRTPMSIPPVYPRY